MRFNIRMMNRMRKIRWLVNIKKPSLNVINGAVWLKILVGRNIKVLSKTKFDNDGLYCYKSLYYSDVSNHDDIDDVWNQPDDGIGPKKTQKI